MKYELAAVFNGDVSGTAAEKWLSWQYNVNAKSEREAVEAGWEYLRGFREPHGGVLPDHLLPFPVRRS